MAYTGKRKRSSGASFGAVYSKVNKRSRPSGGRSFYVKGGRYRKEGFYGRFRGTQIEKKFLDTAYAETVIPATGGNIQSLNLIPQGDTQSKRVGKSCVLKNIVVRGYFESQTTASADICELLVVQDMQCNGANGTAPTVWADATVDINSALNLEYSQRYKVLKRVRKSINSTVLVGGTPTFCQVNVPFSFALKCNIPLTFNSTATDGSIGTIVQNNVFVICRAKENGLSKVAYKARVRFTDQ